MTFRQAVIAQYQLFALVNIIHVWNRLDKIALILRMRGGRQVGNVICECDECP